MKKFLKVFLAALAAVLVGYFLVIIISISLIGGIVGSMGSTPNFMLKDKTVLMISLEGSLNERKDDSPLFSFMGTTTTGLNDLLEAIQKAKTNDFVKGIYLKCKDLHCGMATLEPVRKALIDFKESGKFVVAYGEMYNQGAYYLSSVADKIMMNPQGMFDFYGLTMQVQFIRGLYEKIGVKYQVFKVGTFKSAVEPYIQDKMSEANREQSQSYMDDLWSHWLANISQSRGIPVETLNEYADKYLAFYETDSLLAFGMVDTLMYSTGIENYLKGLTGTDLKEDLNIATVNNMKGVAEIKKKKSKNEIAILYAEGMIVESDKNLGFIPGGLIASQKYVAEINKLKKDEDVKAVVFRVNSPGGSAFASEQIWNAIVELKKEKPVIVSMGDYAASGGYYISCGATRIVAEPTTLTGSIGIFSLIPEGAELAKKIGISFDEVSTNKHSGFGGRAFGLSPILTAGSRAFTDEESRMLQQYVERGYDLFITRCADGRSMTKEAIDAIGQGRVWTGHQALELGLVDRLGSLDDAVKVAAEEAELEDYITKDYPEKEDFMTQLLKSSMGGSRMKITQFLIGEERYKQHELIQTLKNTDLRQAEMPERVAF